VLWVILSDLNLKFKLSGNNATEGDEKSGERKEIGNGINLHT
jgi:hypothetical protein